MHNQEFSMLSHHMELFDSILGPLQSVNREIRFDYDLGRDTRPDSLKPGREFSRVQITTRNHNHNPIQFDWFYHSNADRTKWYLTSLSLRGLGLQTIEEDYLSDLPLLEYLDLQGNQITQFNVSSLKCDAVLHTLNLSSNLIDKIDLTYLAKFNNVRFLNLFNNKLNEINLSGLSGCKSLNRLVVSSNQLTNIDLQPLSTLKYLIHLDFSENEINNISVDLNNFQLNSLLLNDNQLKKIDFTDSYLPELILLHLAENQLANLDVHWENCMPNLQRLLIWNNQLTNITFPNSWETIREIDLNSNRLQSFDLVGDYPNLEELDLAYNNLSSINFSNIKMPHLKRLNLAFNPLGNIDLGDIMKNCSLETLDLAGTQLNEINLGSSFNGKLREDIVSIGELTYRELTSGRLTIHVPKQTELILT